MKLDQLCSMNYGVYRAIKILLKKNPYPLTYVQGVLIPHKINLDKINDIDRSTLYSFGYLKKGVPYSRVHKELVCKQIKEELKLAFETYQLKQFTWEWIETDPGTQLTASINPIIADPEEWYQDYYWPFIDYEYCLASKSRPNKYSVFIYWVLSNFGLIWDLMPIIFKLINQGHIATKNLSQWEKKHKSF